MATNIVNNTAAGMVPSGILMNLELPVSIRFGKTRMTLAEAIELGDGSVVELDSRVDDPVEVVVNGRVVASGQLVVVEGFYAVQILAMPGHGAVAGGAEGEAETDIQA